MKITSVELFVLKSPGLYNNSETAEEPLGPTYMGIIKISTDAGICGYSDMETAAPVAKPSRRPRRCIVAASANSAKRP